MKMDREEEARCFTDLTPRADIRAGVARVVSSLGRFLALHIRRTDHYAAPLGAHTTDDDFESFADRHPAHTIYLATDNAATQQRFLKRYGKRLRLLGLIEPS